MTDEPETREEAIAHLAEELQEMGDLNAKQAETCSELATDLTGLLNEFQKIEDPDEETKEDIAELKEMRDFYENERERMGKRARFFWNAATLFRRDEWEYKHIRMVDEMMITTEDAQPA